MTKFTSVPTAPAAGTTIATHEGGVGFAREPKVELYVTAVSTMVEDTFYESTDERTTRLSTLTRKVALTEPEWLLRFVTWLRGEANMRSVAVLVACEAVKARLDAKMAGYNRQLISAVCQRADEPGQVIAYWQSRHGRNLPMPVKRGVADAAQRLFTERAALRYDGGSGEMRLGDVIELTHPKPEGLAQSALFGWLLDRRHGRRETPTASLDLLHAVQARTKLNAMSMFDRHELAAQVLAGDPIAEKLFRSALAGQWEWAKSWLGQDTEDKGVARIPESDQWELFITSGMGYMALLRNLRNFDAAKVDEGTLRTVKAKLTDPDEVKRSRQFPLRYFAAYQATQGNHWEPQLAQGLNLSLTNVPELGGNTLLLADMSGSMFWNKLSARSQMTRAQAAALFAAAFARRCEKVTLVQFGTDSETVTVDKTESVLASMRRFQSMGGTYTATAVKKHYAGHDRVVLLSDEQAHDGDVGSVVPAEVPIYTWNLGGYMAAHAAGPNRHVFGGLSDGAFSLIPLIERGVRAEFPF